MITTEVLDDRVEMRAFGDYSLADYRELEDVSRYSMRFHTPIKLLLDLRDMSHCSIDALLEQIRFARRHSRDFERIAVVTEDQWVTWSVWFSQFMLEGEVQVFADEEDARTWLSQESNEASQADLNQLH